MPEGDEDRDKNEVVSVPAQQPADTDAVISDGFARVLAQRTGLSKAEARLRHLKALRVLTSCTDVRISLTEGISSVAQGVSAVDSGLNEVIVDEMVTPLGSVPYATLRGSSIIALDGKLPKHA